MESTVARLVSEYESGKISRRQLVHSLAVAAAAFALPRGAAAQPVAVPAENPYAGGFKTVGIDHISFSVADYEKTRDFYTDLMGWRAEAYEDGSKQVRLFWG